MNKIMKFFRMNKFERAISIRRNTYAFLYKKNFACIGKKSYFFKPIYLSGTEYIHIGNGVAVWHNARVELIEAWNEQEFAPQLVIGDSVHIGQDLHLTCAQSIVIEKDVVCTARVTITDISHITSNGVKSILEQGIETKPVKICEGAFIGVNATILPGVTIGKHAVVGSNSVVTKDVPDYAIVAGTPARLIGSKE